MDTALAPTTHALLRPDQVADMAEERATLEQKLNSPRVEDKGAVREQLKRLNHQLDTQIPKPFGSTEIDAAVKREAELREKIRGDGMLSHEEMRKCPPGAVDRHRAWEARNKPAILEWQNIKRRLDVESDNRESASIENFRPFDSSMNMDNALIPGKQFFLPPPDAGPVVTFNSEEIMTLRKHAPDVALRLATYTNEQRAEVKEVLKAFIAEEQAA